MAIQVEALQEVRNSLEIISPEQDLGVVADHTDSEPITLLPVRILGRINNRPDGDLVYFIKDFHPALGILCRSPYGQEQTVVTDVTLLLKNIRLLDIS